MTLQSIKNKILARWFVCRITSSRKSALYGIRFSYPLYIFLVTVGILLENPFVLSITAVIAVFGILLPMHPFDYVYNYTVAKVIGASQIPGRGSELQVNSSVALLFNLLVIVLILFKAQLDFGVLALMYDLSSIFFITILLFNDNFSLYSIFKRGK